MKDSMNNTKNDVSTYDHLFELKRDDFFQGRDDIMQQLDGHLKERKGVCLFGIPGVGKSSCALEYVYKRFDTLSINKKIFWLNAENESKLFDGVCKYAKNMSKTETDAIVLVQIFLKYVNQSENSLLVFDNVENIDDFANIINLDSLNSKFIIITRMSKIKKLQMIEIGPFNKNEAKSYLRSVTEKLSQTSIDLILNHCQKNNQFMPSKLSLIAGLLRDDPTVSVAETLKNCNQDIYIGTIIKKLVGEHNDVIKILQCATLIDSDNISGEILNALKLRKPVKQGLQKLVNLNLCTIVFPNTPQFGIRIHRIFQEDFREFFEKDESYKISQNFVDEVINTINGCFSHVSNDPRTFLYNNIAQHTIEMMRNKNTENFKMISAELYAKLANYYGNQMQDFKNEIRFREKNLEILQDLYSGDHPEIAASLDIMGVSYSKLGFYKTSFKYKKKALEKRRNLYSGDHPDIAASLESMAVSYSKLGYGKTSFEYKKKGLEMRQNLYSGDHPDIAESLNSMAVSYFKLGDDKNAFEYNMKAFEMRQKLYNGDHPDIASSLNSMAISYERLGDDKTAFEYYTEALEMRQKLYSGDHPDIADSFYNVAVSYEKLGDDKKALEYHTKCLEMRQSLFNDDNSHVAVLLVFKLFISYKQQEYDEVITKIVEKLQNDQYKLWLDKEKISIGDCLTTEIEKGILESDIVVCFLTNKYVESKNCRQELFFANNKNKTCVYILLEAIDRKVVNGINIYLYGEYIRLDAYKFKNDSVGIFVNDIYSHLIPLLEKAKLKIFQNK
jgi:tetratricopeptide (TPR) repeat protein